MTAEADAAERRGEQTRKVSDARREPASGADRQRSDGSDEDCVVGEAGARDFERVHRSAGQINMAPVVIADTADRPDGEAILSKARRRGGGDLRVSHEELVPTHCRKIGGIVGNAVVGDHQSASLRIRKMIGDDDRDLAQP